MPFLLLTKPTQYLNLHLSHSSTGQSLCRLEPCQKLLGRLAGSLPVPAHLLTFSSTEHAPTSSLLPPAPPMRPQHLPQSGFCNRKKVSPFRNDCVNTLRVSLLGTHRRSSRWSWATRLRRWRPHNDFLNWAFSCPPSDPPPLQWDQADCALHFPRPILTSRLLHLLMPCVCWRRTVDNDI